MGESILIEAPGALSRGEYLSKQTDLDGTQFRFLPRGTLPGGYLSKSWRNLSLESFYEVSGNPFPGAGGDALRGAGGDTFPGAGRDTFRGARVRLWVQTMDR